MTKFQRSSGLKTSDAGNQKDKANPFEQNQSIAVKRTKLSQPAFSPSHKGGNRAVEKEISEQALASH
ncbi:hypothetical protein [Paenibacillus harenae]|uniref:Uncharacterized protein n=1 Tax=Paenibacillus harenae TaxID=306543 RepID=A0ABT9U8I6_PAEHA|nr:hypothetical protein [Paenibacillus harenae]MDQ0115965.1 hypothetical protein [Paenibacillus harenae]